MPADPTAADPAPDPHALVLVPFRAGDGAVVASWATTPAEVRAWCAREGDRVPPGIVEGWSRDDGVEAWLLAPADGPGRPVGYGELWLDPAAGEVELARLIVDPMVRGRGVGRRLAEALATRARDAWRDPPLVALRVLPGNEAAVRAYRAAGFERVDPATEADWNDGQPTAWWWMRMA